MRSNFIINNSGDLIKLNDLIIIALKMHTTAKMHITDFVNNTAGMVDGGTYQYVVEVLVGGGHSCSCSHFIQFNCWRYDACLKITSTISTIVKPYSIAQLTEW